MYFLCLFYLKLEFRRKPLSQEPFERYLELSFEYYVNSK